MNQDIFQCKKIAFIINSDDKVMPRTKNYSKTEAVERRRQQARERQQIISELYKIYKIYLACGIDIIDHFKENKFIPQLKVENASETDISEKNENKNE